MSQDQYIRGANAARVDPRRVGWILAGVAVVALAVATVALFVTTASNRSSADRLLRRGVPVQVTVTRCAGTSSGIGMGVEYYECSGTYPLGGTTIEAVIHGNRSRLPAGQVLDAVVVPGEPGTLSVAGAGRGGASWAAPIALAGLTVIGLLALAGGWVRGRGRGRRSTDRLTTAGGPPRGPGTGDGTGST
jgi:hypothetical protein